MRSGLNISEKKKNKRRERELTHICTCLLRFNQKEIKFCTLRVDSKSVPADGHQVSNTLLKCTYTFTVHVRCTCTVREGLYPRMHITGDSQTCSDCNIEFKGPLTNHPVNMICVENLHSKECTKRKSWNFHGKFLHLYLSAGRKKERLTLTFKESWLWSSFTGEKNPTTCFFPFFFLYDKKKRIIGIQNHRSICVWI